MKNIKSIMIGLVAVALGSAACTKDQSSGVVAGDKAGSLTVKVAPANPSSRALLSTSDLTGTLLAPFESLVSSYSVFVFDTSGNLEKMVSETNVATPTVIDGLNSATSKRVFVMANATGLTNSSIPTFSGASFDEAMAASSVALQDQLLPNGVNLDLTDPLNVTALGNIANGFLMTGAYTNTATADAIELNPTATTAVTIPIARVVAKVQLGKISFDGSIKLEDLAKFSITGAGIQRAAGASPIGAGTITQGASGPAAFYGAYDGTISNAGSANASVADIVSPALGTAIPNFNDFLGNLLTDLGLNITVGGEYIDDIVGGLGTIVGGILDDTTEVIGLAGTLQTAINTVDDVASLVLDFDSGAFWYVLPNDYPGQPTLLAIQGKLGDTVYYYPIEINTAAVMNSNGTADGTYIQRNTVYTVNLVFHNLVGTTDPDEPGKPASITANIVPQAWETTVTQQTTW
jgi:hypothetical protein